jgi:hypothetical protein
LAISPPSDIVLDVARAATPQDVETARAALAERSGAPAIPFPDPAHRLSRDNAGTAGAPAQTYKRFEAMVLQTFIQNMLPKDTQDVYGKGVAGDMWKSQLAERLADVVADRGGIGIARSLLADHYLDGKRKVPIGPVSGGPQSTEIDTRSRLSGSMVQELQMKITRTLHASDEPDQRILTRSSV